MDGETIVSRQPREKQDRDRQSALGETTRTIGAEAAYWSRESEVPIGTVFLIQYFSVTGSGLSPMG